eukprot:GEMP01031499.1.p1 GENE.GEMP01031499.1~~GEMP01031499.1.p1  ORF type:complete len:398 (+),score=77.56 GEMP01031499.1:291-1484(+)
MSVLFAVFFLWSASAHDTYLRGSKSTMLAKEGVDKALPVEEIDIQRALKTKWEGESSPGVQVEIFKRANEEVKKMLLDGASKEARYALLLEWYPDKIPFASVAQIKKFRGDRGHMDENTKEYADEGKGRNDIKLKLFKNRTPAEQKFLYSGADKMFKLDLCPAADPSVQSELVNPTHEEAPTEVASTETSSAQPQSYLGSAQNTSGTTSCSRVPIVVEQGFVNMKQRFSTLSESNYHFTKKQIEKLVHEAVHPYVYDHKCEVLAKEIFSFFLKSLPYYVFKQISQGDSSVSVDDAMRLIQEPENYDNNLITLFTSGKPEAKVAIDFTVYVVLAKYIQLGTMEDATWLSRYVDPSKNGPSDCFHEDDVTLQDTSKLDGVMWKIVRWGIQTLVLQMSVL